MATSAARTAVTHCNNRTRDKIKTRHKDGLHVVYRETETLTPYAKNSRTHTDEQIAQVAASIREFGFTNPILTDENGGIIAGHCRVLAAESLGITLVPTIPLAGLTDEQKRAYVIADNRLAESATWNIDLLADELKKLSETTFDLDLLGFDDDELQRLLNGEPTESTPESEWKGMPEFRHEDKTAYRSLYVHLKDQAAVDAFAQLVRQNITDSTRYIWYPELEIEAAADKRYGAAE